MATTAMASALRQQPHHVAHGASGTITMQQHALRLCRRIPSLRRVQFPSSACFYRPVVCAATISSQDQTAADTSSVEVAFAFGATVIPHPDKVEKGGEDAYFISHFSGGVLGIADGVSGWAEQNVDPALYSKELMAHAADAVASEEMEIDARMLLQKAHMATSSIGAATAIVAILERKGILHVANVGDCGLRILRRGKIVFATKPQQHYFDCPYQFSSEKGGQSAADASVLKAELKEGDTVVMGSDGLFDNMYDWEIEKTLSIFGGSDRESAERCASSLATLASKYSRDTNYDSPYTKEAVQQGLDLPWYKKLLGQKLTGGKMDDITVIVGHVVREQKSPIETTVELMIPRVDLIESGVDGPRTDVEEPTNAPDQFPGGLSESWA